MKIIKGTTVVLFVIGLALIVIGAILYGKSEALSGWANVQRSTNLEIAGGITFFAGLLCFGIMYFSGSNK